ncbi:MAG: hypothetical protein OXU73_02565 [Candidatus Campbellbacteria bacterium]|nr:hypothetical protein [Candidatus Campbellbacteria bacterium]
MKKNYKYIIGVAVIIIVAGVLYVNSVHYKATQYCNSTIKDSYRTIACIGSESGERVFLPLGESCNTYLWRGIKFTGKTEEQLERDVKSCISEYKREYKIKKYEL